MNILEWALNHKGMEEFFQKTEKGWLIKTECCDGLWVMDCVIDYFMEEQDFRSYDPEAMCPAQKTCERDVSEEELQKIFGGLTVIDDTDGKARWTSEAKEPYFRLRGRRLSEEQAFEILARTEHIFERAVWEVQQEGDALKKAVEEWYEKIRRNGYEGNPSLFFFNDYFSDSIVRYIGGYVWPDGRVGLNEVMYKYPFMDEILDQFMDWAMKYPCLELVLVITKWDCMSPMRYKASVLDSLEHIPNPDRDLDEYQKPYEPITAEDVDCAVEIKPGLIHFLTPEEGLKKLAEYDQQYTEEERRQFASDAYHSHTKVRELNRDYLMRIIEYYGGAPDPVKDYILRLYEQSERGKAWQALGTSIGLHEEKNRVMLEAGEEES